MKGARQVLEQIRRHLKGIVKAIERLIDNEKKEQE